MNKQSAKTIIIPGPNTIVIALTLKPYSRTTDNSKTKKARIRITRRLENAAEVLK
jgi:hypothetical protein